VSKELQKAILSYDEWLNLTKDWDATTKAAPMPPSLIDLINGVTVRAQPIELVIKEEAIKEKPRRTSTMDDKARQVSRIMGGVDVIGVIANAFAATPKDDIIVIWSKATKSVSIVYKGVGTSIDHQLVLNWVMAYHIDPDSEQRPEYYIASICMALKERVDNR
jgi:hypothetical protein